MTQNQFFLNKIIKDKYNLWRYNLYFDPPVSENHQISLGEGWTPILNLPQLAEEMGLSALYLKREDLNPTGSHKDRALSYQISHYSKENCKGFVLSTSGNAGISAAAYAQLAGKSIFIFISPKTPSFKIKEMLQYRPYVILTEKPINFSSYVARKYNLINLRASMDAYALEGYSSIALEIYEQNCSPDAIFIFTTSASSLAGIYLGYRRLFKCGYIEKIPSMHPVQAGKSIALAEEYYQKHKEPLPNEYPAVLELGINRSPRHEQALNIVQSTSGRVWAISKEEAENAHDILFYRLNIKTSMEGVATFAASLKAGKLGLVNRPLVILTGKFNQEATKYDFNLPLIRTYNELKNFFDRFKDEFK